MGGIMVSVMYKITKKSLCVLPRLLHFCLSDSSLLRLRAVLGT